MFVHVNRRTTKILIGPTRHFRLTDSQSDRKVVVSSTADGPAVSGHAHWSGWIWGRYPQKSKKSDQTQDEPAMVREFQSS